MMYDGSCITNMYLTTRYQGSKLNICDWIWSEMSNFDFESMIDIMGGTGAISYVAKKHGKKIIYNDILKFNSYIGTALIENNKNQLSAKNIEYLINEHKDIHYDDFITRTYKNIYYTNNENQWLDMFIGNLKTFDNKYDIALALAALFQSCIIKRPYNLFHRKNLYMRFSHVERSFGNKTTWDKKFEHWFLKFVDEYNKCVFDNKKNNKALNYDVMNIPKHKYDLVYFDPPYTNQKNMVDYMGYYHFLEGICLYLKYNSEIWEKQIDHNKKHLPLKYINSSWNQQLNFYHMFDNIISKFKNSPIIISWNVDCIPSPKHISKILKEYYKNVEIKSIDYKYALSHKKSKEILIIAS